MRAEQELQKRSLHVLLCLMLQRYLVCWEQGLVALLPDKRWLSWGLSQGFINLEKDWIPGDEEGPSVGL